jgi:hypothetical protein
MTHAEAFLGFREVVDHVAIDEAASDVQIMVRRLEDRPELTESERAQVRIAADVLMRLAYDVRKRFIMAAPGTTLFTVI